MHLKNGSDKDKEKTLNTFVKCHTREDAVMYAEALKKQGYRVAVRAATDPKIVDILEINKKLSDEDTGSLYEIYSREIAN
jgi:hypothetical protein